MCDRVEALVAEPPRRVLARVRRGETLGAFGHKLYPEGDPRARMLLETANKLDRGSAGMRHVHALVKGMAALGGEAPTVDLGLVALAAALELPAGSAAALFALGRTAGWVAHALEQRAAGYLLRPRALYVGS
jgi:citrate synthase